MKSAIYVAGLQGKQVVLYVPQNIDRKTMQDVCSLMSEGINSMSKKRYLCSL
jgi:hypothetical protein